MAWTAVNPVSIGNAMKQNAHWSILWDNGDYLYSWLNARKIFTLENTAPAGWTICAGTSDGLLAVKGGAQAYNVSGGTALQGTWTSPNHTHTDGSHTHATASTVLSESTMPAHTHDIATGIVAAAVSGDYTGTGSLTQFSSDTNTELIGGGQGHDHGNTGAAGDGGATGNGATAATWRPLANVGILIEHS